MREFPLEQAAKRASMDARTFKNLVDRRVIFATPRTRALQRGKQKLYTTNEILIAGVLAPLLRMGATTFDVAEIADSLRSIIDGKEFADARAGAPNYLRLAYAAYGTWGWDIVPAFDPTWRGDGKPEPTAIDACEPGHRDVGLASEFVAILLRDTIKCAEIDQIANLKDIFSPSEVIDLADNADFRITVECHVDSEVEAFLAAARAAAADENKWPEVVEA